MHPPHLPRSSIGLLTLLGFACAAPQPVPVAPAPVTLRIEPPVVAKPAPPPPPEAPLQPKTLDELAGIQRLLTEADALYFRGDGPAARQRFEDAWQKHHPSPLTLVMAALSAKKAGDAAASSQLLERARSEARKEKSDVACDRSGFGAVQFDGPTSAWVSDGPAWLRLDVGERRVLHGFCGEATRDPGARAHAPVTWMPGWLDVAWQHPAPSQPGEASVGIGIDLRDDVYGTSLGTVAHTVQHWDFNEEYHGALALSKDRTVIASGSEDVRVWAAADRSLRREIRVPEKHVQGLQLSPDGSLVAVATCDALTVWNTGTGARLAKIDDRYLSCGYGSGIGSSIYSLAFSPDGSLLAVTHFAMGDPKHRPPESESGTWLSLYRTRDGKRTRRWQAEAYRLRFSPDGRLVAGSLNVPGALGIFEVESGRAHTLEGAGPPLGFSPEGRWLVTGAGIVDVADPSKLVQVMEYDKQPPLEAIGPYLVPSP